MTSLDVRADNIRARAAEVRVPSLATILVVLVGLVPWLLGWTVNAGWQLLRLLYAAFANGWETGETRMGPKPSRPGS